MFIVTCLTGVTGCSRTKETLLQPVDPKTAAFPTWVPIYPAEARGSDLKDLWMNPGGTEGWAVGSSHLILHYMNDQWHADTVSGLSAGVEWTSVALVDNASVGFAVGSNGWIVRHENGHHWVATQEGVTADSLTSVWVDPSGGEAFVVGRDGAALRWSGGKWSRAALPGVSNTSMLVDVVGTETEIWVRNQIRILVFARADLTWKRNIALFEAADLWVQPPSPRIWTGGVSYLHEDSLPKGREFTIRWYEGSRTDSVKRIQTLPRASWMRDADSCGTVIGREVRRTDDTYVGKSEYVMPSGTFVWSNPDGAEISALWTNQDCSDGWAVGTRGFVARLRRRRLTLSGMREEFGSPSQLTARYVLVLDSGVPRPQMDSMRMLLLHGEDTVDLRPGKQLSVDTTDARTLRLHVTTAGLAAASQMKGKEVKLQFELPYDLSDPLYRVVYERSGSLVFAKKGWGDYILAGLTVIGILLGGCFLLILLTFIATLISAPVRQFVFSSSGGAAIEDTKIGWIPKMLGALIRVAPRSRVWLFSQYRNKFKAELQHVAAEPPPQVDIVRCPTWHPAVASGDATSVWRAIFEAALQQPTGELWVEAMSGLAGETLLRRWAALALEHGRTPVFIDLAHPTPIEDQIRIEWDRLGAIPDGMPELWTAGGFVFLLSGSQGENTPPATQQFMFKVRGRNLVVVCRASPPAQNVDCHVRVNLSGHPGAASGHQP
jgi:hypothetical protein